MYSPAHGPVPGLTVGSVIACQMCTPHLLPHPVGMVLGNVAGVFSRGNFHPVRPVTSTLLESSNKSSFAGDLTLTDMVRALVAVPPHESAPMLLIDKSPAPQA